MNILSTSLSRTTRATLLVALSATLYGGLGYFGTQLLALNFTISAMLFWRFCIAAIWMLPFVLRQRTYSAPGIFSFLQLAKIFIVGGIFYGGNSALYFAASHYIGTGLAMVIFFTYPLFVVLLARVFDQQRISKPMLIALISIVVGLLLLQNTHTSTLNGWGTGLAIVSAVFYALYIFTSKNNARNLPTAYLTLLVCGGSAALFLCIALLRHEFILPTTLRAWSYIGAVAIIATALPIQLLLEGLKHISAGKVAILSVLEPVLTLLIGILLLREPTNLMQCCGCAVILCSAVMMQFER